MAQITWRNVEAPDFRSSMEGYKLFSDQLNKAFGAAQNTLADFRKTQEDGQSNALMLELSKYAGNPEALTAALQAGEIQNHYDPNKLNTAAISALNSRPGEVIKDAAAQSDLTFTNWGRKNTVNDREALNLAAPIMAEYQRLRGTGTSVDEAAAQKLLVDNKDTLSKLNPAVYEGLLTGGLNLARDQASLFGTRQSNTIAGTRFEWEGTDRKEERDASALASEWANKYVDPADLQHEISTNYDALAKQYGPQVLEAASRRALAALGGGTVGGGVGGVGGGAGGAGSGAAGIGGADPLRVMNYQARGAGFDAVPANVTTLGQASDFAIQVNKAGVPSSAMGVYQIVGDTLRRYAPKVFGANWQKTSFDFDAQDKIAKAIWMDHKNSPAALQKQWTSLSPSQAAEAARLPWEQARVIIAQGESGANPNNLTSASAKPATTAIATGVQHNLSGAPDVEMAQDFQAAWNDMSSVPRDIAAKLIADGGQLKGEDIGNVTDKIIKIMDMSRPQGGGAPRINAAVAGRILARGTAGNKNWFANGIRNFWGQDGLAAATNDDSMRSMVNFASNKDLIKQTVLSTQAQTEGAANAEAARQAVAAAEQALLAKVRAASVKGATKVDFTREQENLDRAKAILAQYGGQASAYEVAGSKPGDPAPVVPTPPPTVRKPAVNAAKAIAASATGNGLGGNRSAAWVPPEFKKPFKTPFTR